MGVCRGCGEAGSPPGPGPMGPHSARTCCGCLLGKALWSSMLEPAGGFHPARWPCEGFPSSSSKNTAMQSSRGSQRWKLVFSWGNGILFCDFCYANIVSSSTVLRHCAKKGFKISVTQALDAQSRFWCLCSHAWSGLPWRGVRWLLWSL